MDDVVHRLKGAKFFAVFDTSKGFFHISLDQESKLLTAMLTPFGILCIQCLSYGTQQCNRPLWNLHMWSIIRVEWLHKHCRWCISIVYGSTYDKFKTNVLAFLDHYVQEDMHLNPDKVKIDCHDILFSGNVLSKEGLSPDNTKVQLIKDWPVPTNHKELQSFLGMVNYLSRFLAFLSDL